MTDRAWAREGDIEEQADALQGKHDFFDSLLRWAHRLLNPPRREVGPAAPTGRPRRVRDRVPI